MAFDGIRRSRKALRSEISPLSLVRKNQHRASRPGRSARQKIVDHRAQGSCHV